MEGQSLSEQKQERSRLRAGGAGGEEIGGEEGGEMHLDVKQTTN